MYIIRLYLTAVYCEECLPSCVAGECSTHDCGSEGRTDVGQTDRSSGCRCDRSPAGQPHFAVGTAEHAGYNQIYLFNQNLLCFIYIVNL